MLAVDAHFVAETDGLRVRIDGSGDMLVCHLEGDTAHLLATIGRSGQALSLLRRLTPLLVRTGLRVEVMVGSVRVGRAGSGVRQNALARLLRLPAAHIGT